MQTITLKINSFFTKLSAVTHTGFAQLLLRLVSAYAAVSAVYVKTSAEGITAKDFLLARSLPETLIAIAGVFLVCSLIAWFIRNEIFDKLLCLFCVSAFSVICCFNIRGNLYFVLAVLLFEAIACFYCLSGIKLKRKLSSTPVLITAYCLLGAFFVLFVGGLCAYRYKTFVSPNYDFGIFTQMFAYMKRCGVPYTTCERDYLLSHFAVHVSPIWYVILPFYFIFSSPVTLQIAQAVACALGLVPLYLLCRHYKLSDTVTFLLGAAYTFFPALAAGCFYDIHENCFLTVCLLCLLYFCEKDNYIGIIAFLLLTLCVKEDAAVYTSCIALYVLIGKKKYKSGIFILFVSLCWFFVVIRYLNTYGDGAMADRYSVYLTGEDSSLFSVIGAVITSPSYVFGQSMSVEKLEFLIQIFLPIAFLPFCCKHISNLILLMPCMLINLMSDYPYQHSMNFQYNFGVIALLFYLAVVNLSEMTVDKRRILSFFAVVASLCLFFPACWFRLSYYKDYKNNAEDYAKMEEVLKNEIPEGASVAANTYLTPHLYEREILYELNAYKEIETRAEYLVFDIRYKEFADLYDLYLANTSYDIFYDDGTIAILHNPTHTE